RAPARGRAGCAAVRPPLAPGQADGCGRGTAGRRAAPARPDGCGREPGQTRRDRLGNAAHDRGRRPHLAADDVRTVRIVLCVVPQPQGRDHIAAGRLVVKTTQRGVMHPRLAYAWRTHAIDAPGGSRKAQQQGLALRWWLDQLESPTTRTALLEHHSAVPLAGM